ncbi:hypothetical protein [Streptoalloteichus hindustanus]|uniref:Uncharacterized protein n=1 Tax=Streptoalloteichus hindustanus TaxID=2017 RepID=A0A1M4UJV4_STRHI|nr:hypothetical protein [Streptoalloteichus hindustanus]SHE56944.1 hypothetical protein SAMN05444320_101452 [Streptoalloteichus hindustanus]
MAVVNVAVWLVVTALVVLRQLRPRPIRRKPAVVTSVLVGALGVAGTAFGVASVTKYHALSAGTVALVLLTFVVAVAFGAVRALSVRVSHDETGRALRQGTVATVVLWLASVGAHLGMGAWIDHTTHVGLLGTSTIYLYVALTLWTQSGVLRRRARPRTVPSGVA